AAEARYVGIPTTDRAQTLTHALQYAIPFHVPEIIIDLLEAIQVHDYNHNGGILARGMSQFQLQVKKQGPAVGESGKVIGCRRRGHTLMLDRIGERHAGFRADGKENTK